MSRLVSAEEARKLLDGIGGASWHRCGANDGQCSCRLIWGDRAMVAKALSCEDKTCDGDGYTVEAAHRNADLIAAAPDLAATVIALTDERNTYHTFAQRIAALVAPPDAVDVAVTHLAPSDLDALAETVAAVVSAESSAGQRLAADRTLRRIAAGAAGMKVADEPPEWDAICEERIRMAYKLGYYNGYHTGSGDDYNDDIDAAKEPK